MTPEIEKRIKAVRAGRVPAGYKKSKVGIVPKEWDVQSFGEISFKTGRKKKKEEDYPVYSINNQKGFCSQAEQFENDGYANTSKDSYTLVEKDTFAYNPARINIGSIGLLKEPDKVIISSLYVCFGLNKNCDLNFFESYFKSHRFNYDVSNYTEGSVRQYLFYDNFSKINVAIPPIGEQKKIAEILATQDKVIELKEKLIAEKQSQKKYLMSMLLGDDFKKPFKLNGVIIDKKKWEKSTIGKISDISTGNKDTQNKKDNGKYPFYVRSPNPERIDTYSYDGEAILTAGDGVGVGKVIHYVTGKFDFHQRVYKISDFDNHKAWGRFVYFYFLEHFYNRVKRMSAKNSVDSVRYNMISEMPLNLPTLPEQKAIADVPSAADEEISLLQKDLEQEKLKKKSLMQLLLTGLVRVA